MFPLGTGVAVFAVGIPPPPNEPLLSAAPLKGALPNELFAFGGIPPPPN